MAPRFCRNRNAESVLYPMQNSKISKFRLVSHRSPPALTTELPALRSQISREQGDSQKPSSGNSNTSTGNRKWPSFTMRRPGRLSSTSSTSASGTASTSSSTHGARSTTSKSKLTTTPCSPAQDGIGSSSLLRSFSAERHRIAVVTTPTTPTCKVDPAAPTNTGSPQKPFVMRSSSSPYRKASVRPDGGGFGQPDRIDSVEGVPIDWLAMLSPFNATITPTATMTTAAAQGLCELYWIFPIVNTTEHCSKYFPSAQTVPMVHLLKL
ncbi:hypothetical protein ACTXT7_007013 [Hymenolepis weldensis]